MVQLSTDCKNAMNKRQLVTVQQSALVFLTLSSFPQAKLAMEAQNKYERELMLHAADVEALQTAKKQAQEAAKSLKEMEEKVQTATAELQQGCTGWAQQEKSLKVINGDKDLLLKVKSKESC